MSVQNQTRRDERCERCFLTWNRAQRRPHGSNLARGRQQTDGMLVTVSVTEARRWRVAVGAVADPARPTRALVASRSRLDALSLHINQHHVAYMLHLHCGFDSLSICCCFTIGVSGWMFLLVPAQPGCPGQNPYSRKTVVCVCVSLLLLFINTTNTQQIFNKSNQWSSSIIRMKPISTRLLQVNW